MKSPSNLIGLIDADFIKYLVVWDISQMYKRGLDPEVEIPYSTAVKLIEARIQTIFDNTEEFTKEYLFLFSGKTRDNYRALIASEKKYKGNRVYKDSIPNEGSYRNIVEEFISQNYNYHKEFDLEADDLCVMGHDKDTYIYSNDKDLRVSPGYHYDIKNQNLFEVSPKEGFRTLLVQSMTGDTVDNIAGIERVGKVGANKLAGTLEGEKLIQATLHAFIEKYGTKDGLDRFVEMYSLVNLKTNRGKWTQEKYKDFFDLLENVRSIGEVDENLL